MRGNLFSELSFKERSRSLWVEKYDEVQVNGERYQRKEGYQWQWGIRIDETAGQEHQQGAGLSRSNEEYEMAFEPLKTCTGRESNKGDHDLQKKGQSQNRGSRVPIISCLLARIRIPPSDTTFPRAQ